MGSKATAGRRGLMSEIRALIAAELVGLAVRIDARTVYEFAVVLVAAAGKRASG